MGDMCALFVVQNLRYTRNSKYQIMSHSLLTLGEELFATTREVP